MHSDIDARRRSRRLALAALVVPALLGCITGCKSSAFYRPPHFRASPSSLDYAEFLYTAAPDPRKETRSVRVLLSGSGYLQYSAGRSRRVHNEFWDERDGLAWEDMDTDQVVLTPDDTRKAFQLLVDSGFFDTADMPARSPHPGSPRIMAAAKVNGRKRVVSTDDPRLVNIIRNLLAQF